MRASSFLAAFAIILASALAAPRSRLILDSIPKELLSQAADSDYDRIMEQTVVSWATAQLVVLQHSQQVEALLTGSGHGWIWGRCQNVITEATEEAAVIYNGAINSAHPNMELYELLELLINAGTAATDVFNEANLTVADLIQSEATDVFPQAEEILSKMTDGIYASFEPLFNLIIDIIWPNY